MKFLQDVAGFFGQGGTTRRRSTRGRGRRARRSTAAPVLVRIAAPRGRKRSSRRRRY